jgi:hypothetical protein
MRDSTRKVVSGSRPGYPGRSLLGLSLFLLLAGPVAARVDLAGEWGAPVPAQTLEEQRGGFINAEGLKVSVGLESLVRINNELRSNVTVQLPNLTELAREGGTLGSQVEVVQNGPGNTLPSDLQNRISGLGTVIQNSLNDQVIQNLKSLNIEISGIRRANTSQIKSQITTQLVESLR